MLRIGSGILLLLILFTGLWFFQDDGRTVVVYTALDQVFAEQIFQDFENETGIRVLSVFDTEATKTTGLAERIRRERERPRCDVYWNNEILRTISLAREGLFAPHESPNAADVPSRFRDPSHHWTGFAARARVMTYDPDVLAPDVVPRSCAALLEERFRDQVVIANPAFGTTGTHMAILLTVWGEDRFKAFLDGLARNGARLVGSNSTSRDRVIAGDARIALTDTDDVVVARLAGERLGISFFEEDGVILIPNTVSVVKGAPHHEEATVLVDYLLSREVEARLAASSSRQIPVRAGVPVAEDGWKLEDLRLLEFDFTTAASNLEKAIRLCRERLDP